MGEKAFDEGKGKCCRREKERAREHCFRQLRTERLGANRGRAIKQCDSLFVTLPFWDNHFQFHTPHCQIMHFFSCFPVLMLSMSDCRCVLLKTKCTRTHKPISCKFFFYLPLVKLYTCQAKINISHQHFAINILCLTGTLTQGWTYSVYYLRQLDQNASCSPLIQIN